MKPHMSKYAHDAQATIIGVPRSMWRQFGIRAMPTLKAYNAGVECPAIRRRDGNGFKQSLDNCRGTPQPVPRPAPAPSPRPSPSPPSGGNVRWSTRGNHMIIQSHSNYLQQCPGHKGFRKQGTSRGNICWKRSGGDIRNEAKQVCAGIPQCKAMVYGQCRG
eukprot:gnl/MRDRNA2_/MRDRNA2_81325_c0_seq2.p1 gnl/MRDRNA2_/MRDRNA2_81325_c0~~gnl/MRDRNA2_/MRDRNA2_81325_c0_seq2.p1  ORF type:complete len:161 (-),score=12.09 gnl/MRDRNA2_/MRDRNA2_81325_c0_seq2:1713-2195(-)